MNFCEYGLKKQRSWGRKQIRKDSTNHLTLQAGIFGESVQKAKINDSGSIFENSFRYLLSRSHFYLILKYL